MKAKADDVTRWAREGPQAMRFFLFGGPDESTAQALAAKLLTAAGPDAERIEINSVQLRDDPARLATEAASGSLFSNARTIRLTILGSGDECLTAVQALFDAETILYPVIAVAGGMTPRAKLMKLAEASAAAAAMSCYQPRAGELAAIAAGLARENHLQLGNADAAKIVAMVGGDQALIARELEKLALYLDAAADRPRQVTAAAIAAIGAETHEEDVSRLVNLTLSGKVAALGTMFAEIAAVGIAEIRMIRALAIRVQLLARLRADVEAGKHPKTLVDDARPPVFWKEKDAVVAQLRIWDSVRLARIMARLLACERSLKAPGTPGAVLFRKLVTDIAHQAARVR
ncbi:MAG: polymerase subunit delta [Pseudomonadota bacterium]